jgi:NAD(P)-dependent dehydrogenase (short-subunit alcohol dehydrogenase family)
MGKYSGQKVAITGGSSGIGRAAALQYAREGASVAVLARNPDRLAETVDALKSAGASGETFIGVSVDVTDDAAVERAAREVLEGLGGLDVLINNAGYARCSAVEQADVETYQRIMDTNFFGHVRMTKALIPHFKAQKRGEICLVSSMLGFMSFYGYGGYAASKFAIVGFAESLRQEMLPYEVNVSVFYPPTTDTPGLESENEDKPPLTWAIEGSSTQYTSEQVADALRLGIDQRRFVNMVGLEAWFIYYANRWVPGIVRYIIDRELWSFVKKEGSRI